MLLEPPNGRYGSGTAYSRHFDSRSKDNLLNDVDLVGSAELSVSLTLYLALEGMSVN